MLHLYIDEITLTPLIPTSQSWLPVYLTSDMARVIKIVTEVRPMPFS